MPRHQQVDKHSAAYKAGHKLGNDVLGPLSLIVGLALMAWGIVWASLSWMGIW